MRLNRNISQTHKTSAYIGVNALKISTFSKGKPNAPDVFIVLSFGVFGFEIPCDVGHFAHSNLSKSKLLRTRKMIRTISLSSQASRDLPSDPARTEGSAQVPIR